MPKIFISHSNRDRAFVESTIIPVLYKHDIDTWYSKADIITADEWESSIKQGLRTCDWFMVIMGPNAVASEWVKDEVHWAVRYRPGRIIPILFEECDPIAIHIRLARIQHVDYRTDLDQARRRLLLAFSNGSPAAGGSQTQSASHQVLGDYHPWTPKTVRLGIRCDLIEFRDDNIAIASEFLDILANHCAETPPTDFDEFRHVVLRTILDTIPGKIYETELAEVGSALQAQLIDFLLDVGKRSKILSVEDDAISIVDDLESELIDSLTEEPPPKEGFRLAVVDYFCEMCHARVMLYAGDCIHISPIIGPLAFMLWRGRNSIDAIADRLHASNSE